MNKHSIFRRVLSVVMCTVSLLWVAGLAVSPADAAVNTVTLKNGDVEFYGSAAFGTRVRWVTHINGEEVDLDDVPGVSRSYAYCVQPAKECPDAGTYPVTVVDDDDTGRLAKMRKLIYYLPGAYGYKSKTKSRWFSGSMGGASAYAIGHVALSFLYDNCSEETDAWKGASSAVKSKVKHMISDLGNLKDPPDDFEVFWIKLSGMQDTFGAIYATEYGKAAVKKQSSNVKISSGNRCYSLAGARYTVYEDAACKTTALCKDGSKAVFELKSGGSSEEITLETGNYYVKETQAPAGYALSTEVHSLEVIKDKTSTFTAHDVPKSKPLGVIVQKKDAETDLAKPQAAASFKGAEFTISYYDIIPSGDKTDNGLRKDIDGAEPAKINGKAAAWVLQTDEEGKIDFSQPDKYLIKEKSADLYKDSKGRPVIPIGIVSIQETKAPEGYAPDPNLYVRYVPDMGDAETIEKFYASDTDTINVREQVYRGDISFSKSARGLKRMKNVPFRITSLTTGESHVIVTDWNGYANTSSQWNKHTDNTNAGGSGRDGIWFNGYNDETGAKPEDTLAALPYDTYLLEELRCESNKGYRLFSDEISITRDSVVIDLGTFDDEPDPHAPTPPDAPDHPHTSDVASKTEISHFDSPKTGDTADLIIYSAIFILTLAELALLTLSDKGGRLNTVIKKFRR
ncbi:MAG: hypothetical protein MJ127_05860 [Mogibacterium sp.]|nr:hypothetical protein [Mogibacterium sp.]